MSEKYLESVDFMRLPQAERQAVVAWQDAMRSIDRAVARGRKLWLACIDESKFHHAEKGWKSWRAVVKKYRQWKNSGESWFVLVNKAKVQFLRDGGNEEDFPGLGNAFKAYAERNQRSCRSGWKAMMTDLRSGKRIEGVGTWEDVWRKQHPHQPIPAHCPADWVPRGWLYENLMRKYPLSSYERANATRGAVAARQFAPPVYTTRVGLKPGQIYQFDDVWHDILVAVPGINRRLVRPLEFACIDVASTCKIGYGIKPQVLRDDQSREGLGKALFKATIVHILCDVGYSPDGCVFVLENGTASLKTGEKEIIERITGGTVTCRTSKILGAQILKGSFSGKGHGNFKAKALLESSHRLIHYAAADLPGQTGANSRSAAVESEYGLAQYAEKLLTAYQHIPPNLRRHLWLGALPFVTYRDLVAELYEIINSRDDHKIEGWEENGWMKEKWSFDGVTDWKPVEAIAALHPSARSAAQEMLRTPGHHKGVRLSPREVWEAAAPGLMRLPLWAVLDFLGDDCYRVVTVGKRGLIEFQDRDLYGTDRKVRFYAACLQPDGSTAMLAEGHKYGLYTIPMDDSRAVVVDAEKRTVFGIVSAWTSVSPANDEAVAASIEAAARVRGLQNGQIANRHETESAAMLSMRQNNKIILEGLYEERKKDGVLVPSKKKAKPLPGAGEAERQRRQSIRAATAALFKTEPEKQGEEYDGSETGW
ncbi:MAG: hypothetical protein IJQ00_04125 [Kiritimatiellae bacterium]|nr:hypothetical protein [Kiritimatiellia bacterium]